MNEENLNKYLHAIADGAIDEKQDPYPGLKKYVKQNTHPKVEKLPAARHKTWQWAGGVALAVLLSLVGLAFTPQGKAFAQQVLQFFTFNKNDQRPMASQDVTIEPANQAIWNLTIQKAEELAGFTVNVPASLPAGYSLDNVIYNPAAGSVIQMYKFHPYSAGEQFNIRQSRQPFLDEIGNSAGVELLTVDGKNVEYVHGSWFGEDGAPTESWQPNSIFHTFRWQDGDYYFALEVLFDETDTWSPAYWTRDGMITMIELIMGSRSDFPAQVNYNNITDISVAEKIAGFHILQPQTLPQGYGFDRAVYDPSTGGITLLYGIVNDSRVSNEQKLVIMEQPAQTATEINLEGYPQISIERIQVGSNNATLASGAMINGKYQDLPSFYLFWNSGELRVIMRNITEDYQTGLDKTEFLSIADSFQ